MIEIKLSKLSYEAIIYLLESIYLVEHPFTVNCASAVGSVVYPIALAALKIAAQVSRFIDTLTDRMVNAIIFRVEKAAIVIVGIWLLVSFVVFLNDVSRVIAVIISMGE